MNPQSIILLGPIQVDHACNRIRSINLNPDDPYQVTIRPYKKNRSLSQNNTYWDWVSDIARPLGYSKDEMHDILRQKFMRPRIMEFEGEVIEVLPSTTKLKVKEMSEYMEDVSRFAAERGISLRYPEDMAS